MSVNAGMTRAALMVVRMSLPFARLNCNLTFECISRDRHTEYQIKYQGIGDKSWRRLTWGRRKESQTSVNLMTRKLLVITAPLTQSSSYSLRFLRWEEIWDGLDWLSREQEQSLGGAVQCSPLYFFSHSTLSSLRQCSGWRVTAGDVKRTPISTSRKISLTSSFSGGQRSGRRQASWSWGCAGTPPTWGRGGSARRSTTSATRPPSTAAGRAGSVSSTTSGAVGEWIRLVLSSR